MNFSNPVWPITKKLTDIVDSCSEKELVFVSATSSHDDRTFKLIRNARRKAK